VLKALSGGLRNRWLSSYASRPLISVDLKKAPNQQDIVPHNRWHPDIPSVSSVKPGSVFRVECLDWLGGQIKNDDNANDIRDCDLTQAHYLTGPIEVVGARPGDVLVVDLLDIGPLPAQMWGFTGIFDHNNGGGFLTKHFPVSHKAIWDFHGIYASSRHIQGVKFAGITHPGLIGCAPSHDLLKKWNSREAQLIATDPCCVPPLALPPNEHGALLGKIQKGSADWRRIVNEAARTVPPREHGGNCDIKNLSRGTRIYFPVYVDGAKLSLGDIHFSQGDGEISFCGAIEMPGFVDMHVDIIKDGVSKLNMVNPIFQSGPVEPRYSSFLTFEGISVDESGKQHYLDAHVAYRMACLNTINYLKRFGYTGEQAYIILGTAPVEGRISGVVDIPNACCTLALPTEIFDFDIRPYSPAKKEARGKLPKADGGLPKPK
jgi:formamidase